MTLKIFTAVTLSIVLSGCIIHPAHKGDKRNRSVQVKTVLEKEHKSPTVVIVTRLPKKGRKCWSHQQHWHCRKN